MLQAAAVLLWISAIGLGIPDLIGVRSVADGKGIPLVLGYPSYGRGPFEQIGLSTTVPLLVAFLLVLVLEAIAGWLLWQSERSGALLALALLVPGAVFWWGFALPFPPIFALVRTILIVLNWSALR